MEEYYCYYKILVVGDMKVGKTEFLRRYVDNKFLKNHLATIGIDCKTKLTELPNGKLVKLKIWDTAGAERFRYITRQYYKGAHGIILLYDVTDESSFMKVNDRIEEIRNDVQSNVVIYLVGAKNDATEKRKVTYEEGEILAKELSVPFVEASAETGYNVNEIFQDLAEKIYKIDNANISEAFQELAEKIDKKHDTNICGANESVRKKLMKFIDY